jgi:subtilisin family serine protease
MPTLKIFSDPGERRRVAARTEELGGNVLKTYQDHTLVEVPDDAATQLQEVFAVEDVTPLYAIPGSGRQIDTSRPRIDRKGEIRSHPDYADEDPLPEGPHHYLVQFLGPVRQEWLAGVVDAGGELRAPYGNFTYVVRADQEEISRIARLDYVRWAGHLPYRDRVSPSAHDAEAAPPGTTEAPQLPGRYTVEFFRPFDADAAKLAVEQVGFEVVAVEPDAGIFVVRTKAGRGQPGLEELAAVHGVKKVRPRFLAQLANNFAVRWMGLAKTIDNPGLGLDGTGQVVAVCDSGLDTGELGNLHLDFGKRVASLVPYPVAPDILDLVELSPAAAADPWSGEDSVSGHGTHVSGSVLGDGTASRNIQGGPIRGLAPAATLVFQAVGRDVAWKDPQINPRLALSGLPLNLGQLLTDAAAEHAQIHCNAWYRGEPGEYDAEQCAVLDQFVWDNKTFCVVVAAGNARPQELNPDGTAQSGTVKAPGTAKNCITVGASGSNRRLKGLPWGDPNRVADFSCRGPAAKARHKPDVVAPGDCILSTRSSRLPPDWPGLHRFSRSQRYFFLGGTSQATALVSGAVALLRQHLVREGFDPPSAALLKAVLIAGATRLPGPGDDEGVVVDDVQGYGRVNLDAVVQPQGASVRFEEVTPGLADDQVVVRDLDVRSPDVPLRVVLAYTDRPGERLVNNLNLRVLPPRGGEPLLGNQPQRPRGGTAFRDTENNVEVVHVERPAAGRWHVEVVGGSVPEGPQDFALVYRCDM